MDHIYRLGVLSDTHIFEFSVANELAAQLLRGPFSQVDAVLHAGDMVIADFENCFEGIPVYSVQGNMDAGRYDLPLRRIIEVAGFRIGLIHGWGAPAEVPRNVLAEFDGDKLDLLVFGHSHTPYKQSIGQTLLFNPGSAMDHRGYARGCTVGLVEVGPALSACHIPFELESTGPTDFINNNYSD